MLTADNSCRGSHLLLCSVVLLCLLCIVEGEFDSEIMMDPMRKTKQHSKRFDVKIGKFFLFTHIFGSKAMLGVLFIGI